MQTQVPTLHDLLTAALIVMVTAFTTIAGAVAVAWWQDTTPFDVLALAASGPVSFTLTVVGMAIYGHLVSEVGKVFVHWWERSTVDSHR